MQLLSPLHCRPDGILGRLNNTSFFQSVKQYEQLRCLNLLLLVCHFWLMYLPLDDPRDRIDGYTVWCRQGRRGASWRSGGNSLIEEEACYIAVPNEGT